MASAHERERKVPAGDQGVMLDLRMGRLQFWDGKTEDQEIAIMSCCAARFPVRMRKLSAASNNHNNNSKITCKTVMVFVVAAAAAAVEQ